ncbi:MAG: DUF6089 family protein [Bacteroidia bacterium]|jgi:hypothetical protein|nr:DUF6089 family protein [Bacteroidia bacterium]
MKSISKILVAILVIATTTPSYSQKMDIGLLAGMTGYYGDVVNEFEPALLKPGFGAFFRYRLGGRLALRANFLYTSVEGDDQRSQSQWQNQRNWTFTSRIIEGSALLEFNFIEDRNQGRRFANPFIPYAFGGVGFFTFDPQSDFNGTMISVAPLQLSGVAYQTNAICVPLGIGFRYYLNRKIQLGAELGIRYTTTSYIDDIGVDDRYQAVETTPNPAITTYFYNKATADNNAGDFRSKMGAAKSNYGSNFINNILGSNDLYYNIGLTLSYTLGDVGKGGGGSRGRGFGKAIRCPRFY